MKLALNFALILVLLFTLGSCTNKSEKAKVTITMPPSSVALTNKVQTSSVISSSSDSWNGSISDFAADVNCYVLAVGQPENLTSYCENNADPSVKYRFTHFVGAIPAGETVEIEVDAGNNRKFFLFGMKADAGACVDWHPSGPDKSKFSHPRVISSKSNVDLVAGDNQINMTLPGNDISSLPELNDCEVPGQSGGGGVSNPSYANMFGDGSDGDYTVDLVTSDADLDSDLNIARRRILSTDSTGQIVTVTPGFTGPQLSVGDEVLIIINQAGGGGFDQESACGTNNFIGKYKFTKVLAITNGGQTIQVDHSFFEIGSGVNSVTDITTALAEVSSDPNPTLTRFCRAQIMRVPKINELTINTGSFLAKVSGWDGSTGGVMAFKAKKIILNNTATAEFNVAKSGFRGGASASSPAEGSMGINSTLSEKAPFLDNTPATIHLYGVGNGGVHYTSDGAGGGGANGGKGGLGYSVPFAGNFMDYTSPTALFLLQSQTTHDLSGCGLCQPSAVNKLTFGGGGAWASSASNSGGNGGGVILANVKEIDFDSSQNATLKFNAEGGEGPSEGTGNNGVGGGAGGTVYFNTFKVNNGHRTNRKIYLKVNGANGGDVTTGGSNHGGGGAGAGLAEMRYCHATDVNDGIADILSVYALGGTGGVVSPTTKNGDGGSDGPSFGAGDFGAGDLTTRYTFGNFPAYCSEF